MKDSLTGRDLVFLLGFVPAVAATSGEGPHPPPNQVEPANEAVQPMELDEPMPIGMAKEGMKFTVFHSNSSKLSGSISPSKPGT